MNVQRVVRISLSLFLVLIFLLHASKLIPILLFQQFENLAYDFRLRLTMPRTIDEKITILDIDERSLSKLGHWPWPRTLLAKVIEKLATDYAVKAIGFDVVFAEADRSSGLEVLDRLAATELKNNENFLTELEKLRDSLEYDQIFANSLKNRNVVLGYVFQRTTDKAEAIKSGALPHPIGYMDENISGRVQLHTNIDYTGNIPLLQDAAHGGGFFDNPFVDRDGVFRRAPLLQIYQGGIYQSLALAMTRVALNNPDITINVVTESANNKQGYSAIETIALGDKIIPVDEETAVLIPYRGAKKHFPYLSIVDVLEGKIEPDLLKDKLVLIGTTAAGLKDLRIAPVDETYPGVEVHANIISGILENRILYRPAYTLGYEVVLCLLLGIGLSLLLPFISPLMTLLVTLTVMGVMTASNLYIWTEWNLVLPLASPLLLVLSIFVLQMSYGFFVESRGKRKLAKLFGQYIPPELVDEMSRDSQEISMQSRNKKMTVLFSDVRDFTSISESLSPHELSRLINSFLTPMTHVIHKYRGTIDKYMGDAVMAFWGAPLDDELHARHALSAAIEMLQQMNELRPIFKNQGWPEMNIGIGINTGDMRVGNMGSEFRMAYTVMGDAVNLASRLEGLTKEYQVQIIVSEATKTEITDFEYRELDIVRVKGKDRPVSVFEPIGSSESVDKALKAELRRYHKALQFYRQQEWDIAERELFSLASENKHCHVYRMYLDRIAHFRMQPPAEDWDGVFSHGKK